MTGINALAGCAGAHGMLSSEVQQRSSQIFAAM
jgi:hypothetical protein